MSEKQRAPKQGRAAQRGAASRCKPSQANLRPSVPPQRQAASNTTTGRGGEQATKRTSKATRPSPGGTARRKRRRQLQTGGERGQRSGATKFKELPCARRHPPQHILLAPPRPCPQKHTGPLKWKTPPLDRRARKQQERSEQSRARGTHGQVPRRKQPHQNWMEIRSAVQPTKIQTRNGQMTHRACKQSPAIYMDRIGMMYVIFIY